MFGVFNTQPEPANPLKDTGDIVRRTVDGKRMRGPDRKPRLIWCSVRLVMKAGAVVGRQIIAGTYTKQHGPIGTARFKPSRFEKRTSSGRAQLETKAR